MRRRSFLGLLFGAVAAPLAPKPKISFKPRLTHGLGGLRLTVTDKSAYEFGFTGFKPADNNTITGQILYHGNVQVRAVRQLRGIR